MKPSNELLINLSLGRMELVGPSAGWACLNRADPELTSISQGTFWIHMVTLIFAHTSSCSLKTGMWRGTEKECGSPLGGRMPSMWPAVTCAVPSLVLNGSAGTGNVSCLPTALALHVPELAHLPLVVTTTADACVSVAWLY